MRSYLVTAQLISTWLIIIACFFINLPTAAMSIAVGLMLILFLISGDYQNKYIKIKSNPGALIALVLIALYTLGVSYSSAPTTDAFHMLNKYLKLLLIPIVIATIPSDKYRKYAINSFLISTIIVLIISYLKLLGIIHHVDTGQGYSVFKNRIAGSIFMAYGLYLMMHRALIKEGFYRATWATLAILALFNIFLLVNGRTGQVVAIALIAWFIFEIYGLKSIKYFGVVLLSAILIYKACPQISGSRLASVAQEIKQHNGTTNDTSAGLRLEFYKNTFILIKNHIILGGGTGSLESEYRPLAEKQNLSMQRVPNPHNQFLLTTQELGLIGLAALFCFWLTPWICSYKLVPKMHGIELRGLIITITIGSLFNSLLLDAGEGRFYCVIAGVLLSAYESKNPSRK